MEDRRNFLKVFGLGSALVVGASGEAEVVESDKANPLPRPKLAGDERRWEACRDVVAGVLYDKITVERNSLQSTHRFFIDGWSSDAGPEKTNVWAHGRLDAPNLFQVRKFGVTFTPGISPELLGAILNRYSMKLWLGNRHYFDAPLVECFGKGSDPTADFKTLYSVKDLPVVIGYDHSFALEISGTPLPVHPKLALWGVMHGFWARGIA